MEERGPEISCFKYFVVGEEVGGREACFFCSLNSVHPSIFFFEGVGEGGGGGGGLDPHGNKNCVVGKGRGDVEGGSREVR